GVNAIQKMCTVIPALYELPCFHRSDPVWGRSPINAMIISGGGKVSASVPDECECRFDIRLNPDLTPAALGVDIAATLEPLQQADPELRVEVEKVVDFGGTIYQPRAATYLPADDPLVSQIAAVIADVRGDAPRLGEFPGG